MLIIMSLFRELQYGTSLFFSTWNINREFLIYTHILKLDNSGMSEYLMSSRCTVINQHYKYSRTPTHIP